MNIPYHIINRIYWYLWHFKIKDVNKQYLYRFKWYYDEYLVYNKNNEKKMCYNYRGIYIYRLTNIHTFNFYTLQRRSTYIQLPKRYWFSNGSYL